jgi:hypothetical protein
MITTLLLAFWLAQRHDVWLAMLALGTAFSLKYIPLLLVPFFLIYASRTQSPGRRVATLLLLTLIFLGTVAVLHSFYPSGLTVFWRVAQHDVGIFRNSLAQFLFPLAFLGGVQEIRQLVTPLKILFAFTAVGLGVQALRRWSNFGFSALTTFSFTVLLLYLLIGCSTVQEWYLGWIVPCGLLIGRKAFDQFIIGLSAGFLSLVIFTIDPNPNVGILANHGLYLFVLWTSYRTLRSELKSFFRNPLNEAPLAAVP